MADTELTTNLHPVDRMAEIRAEILALEAEFAACRRQVVSGQVTPEGTDWIATIAAFTRRSIRVADAKRLLDPDVFDAILHTNQQTNVYLRRRK